MRKKPIVFTAIFLASLAIAFSLPFQVMNMAGHHLGEYQTIFYKISPYNWCVIGACFINALLALRASPILKISLPVSLAVIAVNNYQVSQMSDDYAAVVPILATLAYLAGLVGIAISDSFRTVMMNPSLRWWLTPARYKARYETWIGPQNKRHLITSTYDISKTGAFLMIENENDPRWGCLEVGDQVRISVRISNNQAIQCRARVVRFASEVEGKYPIGMGVQFEEMTNRGKKLLDQILDSASVDQKNETEESQSLAA